MRYANEPFPSFPPFVPKVSRETSRSRSRPPLAASSCPHARALGAPSRERRACPVSVEMAIRLDFEETERGGGSGRGRRFPLSPSSSSSSRLRRRYAPAPASRGCYDYAVFVVRRAARPRSAAKVSHGAVSVTKDTGGKKRPGPAGEREDESFSGGGGTVPPGRSRRVILRFPSPHRRVQDAIAPLFCRFLFPSVFPGC